MDFTPEYLQKVENFNRFQKALLKINPDWLVLLMWILIIAMLMIIVF